MCVAVATRPAPCCSIPMSSKPRSGHMLVASRYGPSLAMQLPPVCHNCCGAQHPIEAWLSLLQQQQQEAGTPTCIVVSALHVGVHVALVTFVGGLWPDVGGLGWLNT